MRPAPQLASLLSLVLLGCTTTPVAPLPGPLRENHGWGKAQGSMELARRGAFLGLRTRENLGTGFDELDFPPGVRVTRVVENSPAQAAGLALEDVILSMDGQATDDPGTLDALVDAAEEGHAARLEVQRGDQLFELTVPLGAAQGAAVGGPAPEPVARLDPARSRAGWLTVPGGVALVLSHPEAPFPRDGVPEGSVVHDLDGQPVHSDLALVRALQQLEPGTTVEVSFTDPRGERRTRRVTLQDEERRVTRCSFPILFGYSANPEGTETSFTLIDLWLLELFRYERQDNERRWEFLSLIEFATGIGELAE